MISSLSGKIQGKDGDGIVLDVSGVGYRVLLSLRSLELLGGVGDGVFVHTYLQVREDAMSLYGFAQVDERSFFESLISVSGVGPKVALAVLSAYGPDDLKRAVFNKDVALFQSISGIGKKTAERLVLELKDKVGDPVAVAETAASGNGNYFLAREALISLGYNFAEAEAALAGAEADTDVEELVRQALKQMTKKGR